MPPIDYLMVVGILSGCDDIADRCHQPQTVAGAWQVAVDDVAVVVSRVLDCMYRGA